ncbi:reverse transcriptase [Senna tora]|uniref:Reverse transcriptase n=1 Tax=Senna tora TaxID=362788 RepID=A0A834WNF3_9FABA|nr:reverse transcriptase [Senna tora]
MVLPVKISNETENANRGFIWGDQEGKRKVHLVAWDQGLIARKEVLWSKVLLAKYGYGTEMKERSNCNVSRSWLGICNKFWRKNRGMTMDERCSKCGDSCEYLIHLLCDCPETRNIYMRLVRCGRWPIFFKLTRQEWIKANLMCNFSTRGGEWR